MLSYSEVWNALKETDEDPANPNNVILLYTNESRSKNLNGGNVGDWNREHVWAKSMAILVQAWGLAPTFTICARLMFKSTAPEEIWILTTAALNMRKHPEIIMTEIHGSPR